MDFILYVLAVALNFGALFATGAAAVHWRDRRKRRDYAYWNGIT